MSVLAWIALGLLGGLVAGWLWGSRGRVLLADATVASLGAILGGFIASALLGIDVAGLHATSIVVAVLGATCLLMLLHAVPGPEPFED